MCYRHSLFYLVCVHIANMIDSPTKVYDTAIKVYEISSQKHNPLNTNLVR